MEEEVYEEPKLYCIFSSIPDDIVLPPGHVFGEPNPDGEYIVRNCYQSQYPDHCEDVTRTRMKEWKAKYATDTDSTNA